MNRYIYIYYDKKDYVIKDIIRRYKKHLYEFHKRYTKLKLFIDDKYRRLVIKIIGFDGRTKIRYTRFDVDKILDFIDSMPMGSIQRKSLSLYSDYNPKTTIKGLGYKNRDKALYTINMIKGMDKKYQINVINTMINRAKHHKYFNNDMNEAIKVFKKYKKGLIKRGENG